MWAVLLLAAAPALFAQFEYSGQIVQSIEFRTDATYDTGRIEPLITTKVGEPLSVGSLQQTIKSLYGVGDFRDVRVDAAEVPGGVALTLVLSLNYRIRNITVEGAGDEADRIKGDIKVKEDDVLSLNAVDRSAVAIQRTLSRRGYLQSAVDPEVKFFRQENRADVIFHVDVGPLAHIAGVNFQGDLGPFTPDELIGQMHSKPGEIYRIQEARRDVDRIRNYLVNKDRRRADVRFQGGEEDYDPATQTITLVYKVDVGPVVEVDVEGVPKHKISSLVPFHRNEAYSEDVVDRAADEIIQHYQSRGYFNVAVSVDENEVDGVWHVIYKVDPGQKVRLEEVRFDGNEKIDDSRLRKVISTAPVGGFKKVLSSVLRTPVGVTQQQLSDDRDALEAFYKLQGFHEVKVGRAVPEVHAGTMTVTFPITEGPQTIVSEVVVEGNDQVRTERLPDLQLEQGDPLDPQQITNDVVALKSFYGDRGYVEIQVSPTVHFTPDRTGARVIYQIAEGPKVDLGEVVVRGNTYTDRDLILRKARLEPGNPFSYQALLDAQRNLYRLGIFQRVDLLPQQSGTGLSTRDVVIQVEEGKALTVAGSLGYSTEDGARGSASISHRNLFGSGRYAGLEATVSQRVQRYQLTYREPFLWKWDMPTQLTLFRREEIKADGKAKIESTGTFVEATRVVTEELRWSVRYEYRIVQCLVRKQGDLCDLATSGLPIEGIPREDQQIEISSVTPNVFYDHRDDAINPSRGYYAGGSLEYAFPLFRADASFLKNFDQGGWIRPISRRTQVVVAGRLGLIDPLRSGSDGSAVPFAERFLAGGRRPIAALSWIISGSPARR